MLQFRIIPELLYPRAVAMGILFFACCAAFGLLWHQNRHSRLFRRRFSICAAALGAGLLAVMVFCPAPDHDEVEHASATWQVSQGLVPYEDFFQHHSPMLWILAAPLFRIRMVSEHPVECFRMVAALLSLCVLLILCLMARRIWQEKAAGWAVFILFAGYFLRFELYNFRPVVAANICILSAFWMLMEGRKILMNLFAGFLLGFALSLSPRYAPFLLLMPLWALASGREWKQTVRMAPFHGIGLLSGILPLCLWLAHHSLFGPFHRFVLAFNAGRMMEETAVFGGTFDVLATVFACWGCSRLLCGESDSSRYQGRLLSVMLALSALVYLTMSKTNYDYYQQMYILSAILAGSGLLYSVLKEWAGKWFSIPAFLLAGFILWPGIHSAQRAVRRGDFVSGMRIISTLRRAAGADEVVCITPDHPITSRNATYISTGWQYRFCLSHPCFRERGRAIARDIMATTPSIVFERPLSWQGFEGISRQLRKEGLISEAGSDSLQHYLEDHYRLVQLYPREYWIRNDRYDRCFR